MYNGKFKHICHRHNTIKHLLLNIIISFDYVKSKKNIAHPLTKSLLRELVYNSLMGVGLKPLKIKECSDDNPT
jgi:hypothetical protein